MTDSIRRRNVERTWMCKRQSVKSNAAHADFVDYSNFSDCGKSGSSDFSSQSSRAEKQLACFGRRVLGVAILFVAFFLSPDTRFAPLFASENWTNLPSFWMDDYDAAVQTAKDTSRSLLIYFVSEVDSPSRFSDTEERFVPTGKGEIRQIAYVSSQRPLPLVRACREFEYRVLFEGEVLEQLDRFVLLKLPINATTRDETGRKIPLLKTPTFREMQEMPGLAVMDFEHKEAPYYGDLVGILPFLRAKTPSVSEALTFLKLPSGTLTQRTLIYAVRTHPEKPLSTESEINPILLKEANGHSAYQAKVRVLGHQNFGSRTSRIASALNCIGASEICAQSWSGEGLFEGAIGCVRSWRTSSGHWNGVRSKNRYYGYDMVRGDNGIWYATGLFVK